MISTMNSKRINMKMQNRTSKSYSVGEESKNMLIFFFRMCLSLFDYQSKASRYRKGLT